MLKKHMRLNFIVTDLSESRNTNLTKVMHTFEISECLHVASFDPAIPSISLNPARPTSSKWVSDGAGRKQKCEYFL